MGPNTNDRELMKKLVENGMDIARFNFSHGDHEEQKSRMDMLKAIREEAGKPIAILLDTKGPEIRTGVIKDDKKVTLVEGQKFTLTTKEVEGDANRVSITYEGLVEDVEIGKKILIDDGLIELEVKNITDTDIICRVINGGELGQKKGVNVPNVPVRLPALTEKDRQDIIFGVEQGVDFIAASFVRSAEGVLEIKALLKECGAPHLPVIAKIENAEGKMCIRDRDTCVGRAVEAIKEVDGQMFICADHGNAEQLVDYETGEPFTAHTTNPVPFILVNADPVYKLREGGCLADIAPTLIELMGMEQPKEMTGTSLLVK